MARHGAARGTPHPGPHPTPGAHPTPRVPPHGSHPHLRVWVDLLGRQERKGVSVKLRRHVAVRALENLAQVFFGRARSARTRLGTCRTLGRTSATAEIGRQLGQSGAQKSRRVFKGHLLDLGARAVFVGLLFPLFLLFLLIAVIVPGRPTLGDARIASADGNRVVKFLVSYPFFPSTSHHVPKAQVEGDKFFRILGHDVLHALDLLLVLRNGQHDKVAIEAAHIMSEHTDGPLLPFQVAAEKRKSWR